MELIVRATALYWFLFLVMRGTGKRSLAELTPLDILVLVIMGDLIQPGVNQEDLSITGAIIAVSVFAAWTLVGDWVGRRWPPARRVLEGCPVIVVRDGKLVTEHLRRERLTEGDLKAAARAHGYDDLAGVTLAVLEDDGTMSFLGDRSSST